MATIELKAIVKKKKPVTAGQRHRVDVVTPGLHKGKPQSGLTYIKTRSGGRNNSGRMTVEGLGGGHKQRVRIIDWKRSKDGIPAKVERFEYDPNRSANLALLLYADGERRYMIAPKKLKIGDTVQSGRDAPIKPGNCLPLSNMPVGTVIHCIEMKPGQGAKMVRSAGGFANLLAREGSYATIRLRSGEMRLIHIECRAVVGEVGNSEHGLRVIGKAGGNRWRGKRPNVRAVAKNPVDHPMGGGEGRTSGGRPPCNKNGKPEGKKTRSRKKTSNKFIVRRRGKKK